MLQEYDSDAPLPISENGQPLIQNPAAELAESRLLTRHLRVRAFSSLMLRNAFLGYVLMHITWSALTEEQRNDFDQALQANLLLDAHWQPALFGGLNVVLSALLAVVEMPFAARGEKSRAKNAAKVGRFDSSSVSVADIRSKLEPWRHTRVSHNLGVMNVSNTSLLLTKTMLFFGYGSDLFVNIMSMNASGWRTVQAMLGDGAMPFVVLALTHLIFPPKMLEKEPLLNQSDFLSQAYFPTAAPNRVRAVLSPVIKHVGIGVGLIGPLLVNYGLAALPDYSSTASAFKTVTPLVLPPFVIAMLELAFKHWCQVERGDNILWRGVNLLSHVLKTVLPALGDKMNLLLAATMLTLLSLRSVADNPGVITALVNMSADSAFVLLLPQVLKAVTLTFEGIINALDCAVITDLATAAPTALWNNTSTLLYGTSGVDASGRSSRNSYSAGGSQSYYDGLEAVAASGRTADDEEAQGLLANANANGF